MKEWKSCGRQSCVSWQAIDEVQTVLAQFAVDDRAERVDTGKCPAESVAMQCQYGSTVGLDSFPPNETQSAKRLPRLDE